uniref:Uncharacterized protein n=1 Tax=Timema cristinae TaxID=61476 RepID=A0A7R9DNL5_TIMCR|nr:unnamed protein product [Timema cristinae]
MLANVSDKQRGLAGVRTSLITPIFAQHTSLMEQPVHTEQIALRTRLEKTSSGHSKKEAKKIAAASLLSLVVSSAVGSSKVS